MILDPIYTLVVSILVIISTFGVTKSTFRILVEATPSDIDCCGVRDKFSEIKGVLGVFDLHIWPLAAGKPALMVHLYIDETTQAFDILAKAREVCHNAGIRHCTIQVEDSHDDNV